MFMEMRWRRRLNLIAASLALPVACAAMAQEAGPQVMPPPITAPDPAVSDSVGAPVPAMPADQEAQAIYRRIMAMMPTQGGPLPHPQAALAKALIDFYTQRSFEPAWNDEENVRQLFDGLASLDGDGLVPADYGLDALRQVHDASAFASASPEQRADFDMHATTAYLTALVQLARGKVNPQSLDPVWNYDLQAIDPKEGLAMVDRAIQTHAVTAAFDAARPQNPMYGRLRDALARLRQQAGQGGWPVVPEGPTLKPGMKDARVQALRERLVAGGYLDAAHANGQHYDDVVQAAVKHFQADQYLDVDGNVGAGTLAALNVSAQTRVDQVRANLERARWLLHALQGTFVVVDVAGFKISYYRDGQPVWTSRVQVGKPYRSTPIFRSQINYVTFNPTWTVPPTILKNDILPKIRKNPSYLASQRIRVMDSAGNPVAPSSVNWANPKGIVLRQDAGPENSLGQVVIRFPNDFAIYLHDTPHKELFDKAKRDTSSGCIRVEHPLDLVTLLFNDPEKWSREAIDARLAEGRTENVTLPTKVPILLAYWTVDLRDDGQLAFKQDIYGRDPELLAALAKPQALPSL